MDSFSLPASVKLVQGSGGYPQLQIATPLASASVYLYGAQVAAYTPAGQDPVLFFSRESYFTPGKPMRGGVPVIFPWFGAHATDPGKPAHGFARTREWALEEVTDREGEVTIVLRLDPDADAERWWPGNLWTLRHRITIGRSLRMELEVTNRGEAPFVFEEALHTYFAIRSIHEVAVVGLEELEYLTVIEDAPRKRQGVEPIRFTRETDRVYLNAPARVEIQEPHRTIVIEKEGADSVVVWNPWTDRAAQFQDLANDEWPTMVCVETGNARDNRKELAPGAVHRSVTTITL